MKVADEDHRTKAQTHEKQSGAHSGAEHVSLRRSEATSSGTSHGSTRGRLRDTRRAESCVASMVIGASFGVSRAAASAWPEPSTRTPFCRAAAHGPPTSIL